MTNNTQLDLDHLRTWIGAKSRVSDYLGAFPANALMHTLGLDGPEFTDNAPLPPLWHWLYFLPLTSLADTGLDGHPTRGDFLPPVPFPKRMWAGSRLTFAAPVKTGQRLEKRSVVQSIEHKSGRSGELVFVTVRHEIYDADIVLLEEEHDIVYREIAGSESPSDKVLASSRHIASTDCAFERAFTADAVLLFRYSAMTFNSHRIHYDYPYATNVEGYKGLVVHGPLVATLLLDLLRRECPHFQVKAFNFKNISPVFDNDTFFLRGQPLGDGSIHLWAQHADGGMIMDAKVHTMD